MDRGMYSARGATPLSTVLCVRRFRMCRRAVRAERGIAGLGLIDFEVPGGRSVDRVRVCGERCQNFVKYTIQDRRRAATCTTSTTSAALQSRLQRPAAGPPRPAPPRGGAAAPGEPARRGAGGARAHRDRPDTTARPGPRDHTGGHATGRSTGTSVIPHIPDIRYGSRSAQPKAVMPITHRHSCLISHQSSHTQVSTHQTSPYPTCNV